MISALFLVCVPQDGFVQAEGTPDPSEQKRQDQQPPGPLRGEQGAEKETTCPGKTGERPEECSHPECSGMRMRGRGEVRGDGRGGQACKAENPGSGIVPSSVGSGSWALRLGGGPHPRLVTQSRLSQRSRLCWRLGQEALVKVGVPAPATPYQVCQEESPPEPLPGVGQLTPGP